jgi:hypothetical protein
MGVYKESGKITISCVSSNISDGCIEIRLCDDASRIEFVTAQLTFEALSRALTGQSHIPCEIETNALHLVGKRMEHKYELVRRPNKQKTGIGAFTEVIEILGPLEVDGWVGRVDDMYNHHNWRDKNEVRVSFTRYVDSKTGDLGGE